MDRKTSYTREHFVDYLKEHHLRATPERLAIFDAAVCQNHQFCADDVRCILANTGFHVSTATIYNNINLLVRAGLLQRAQVANGTAAYYERAQNATHIRLICSLCGRTREVRAQALTQLIKAQDFKTFAQRHFTLNVYGLCRKCERISKHSNKQP